jgi:catechol 2,3-dioxygenase-like lactoylglutathione lyase family enzyme/glutaredoxin
MKGTHDAPRCGFSARVVELVDGYVDSYTSVDILGDEALREGVKQYAEWPTFPQLWVDGAFVGGSVGDTVGRTCTRTAGRSRSGTHGTYSRPSPGLRRYRAPRRRGERRAHCRRAGRSERRHVGRRDRRRVGLACAQPLAFLACTTPSKLSRETRRTWRSFRTPRENSAGIRWFFVEPGEGALEPAEVPLGHVHALDHLVINTPNPDRAMALYGAKLGLRPAMDRTAPEWGVRLIFLRTGGLTVEIAHRLAQAEDASGPDAFWGLTWRVGDIEAAHDRLAGQGFSVSEVRTGRRAGTRVFTVRDGTLNVPTLFISGGAD